MFVPSKIRFLLGLPFASEELTAKLLQHLLRRLDKRKDVDPLLRQEMEFTLRRLLAFILAKDESVEMVAWKEFVKTKNLIKTIVLPLVKVDSEEARCEENGVELLLFY